MSQEDSFITWNDSDHTSKAKAFDSFSDSMESYEGISKGYHRDFLDIEPNRSVRPQFGRNDYNAFRPNEATPRKQKRAIKLCMDAYEKVGIVRNVIDLMGDFGCQGINIVHENKSVEKFYKQWFKKIEGKERSERFLNNLYKTGQVFVYRSYANITPEIKKYMRSMANDIRLEVPVTVENVVPWRYNFFNPLNLDMKNGSINLFLGRKSYELSTNSFFDNFKDGSVPAKIMETLPPNVKNAIKSGQRKIELDPERLSVHYYKKDDWQQWAYPLTYAILDDIIMLEKMKLADLSALDGAISNIRLWTVGSLDHKILPNKAVINKLRNILASNVGGGTMELVWGPELSYTESNSQVYKFLGSEKYTSVLNSIYAGLGVPPTLTGMANNGGGFTNNFISLKTLVERLQYGRDQLTKFWEKELEFVRKSMGFRKSAHVVYDQMSLSDESSEKQLLIQLADRDIISHETVLERFKEIPVVEKVRLSREGGDREADRIPPKASPFHNANQKLDLEKMEKQTELNDKKKEKEAPKPQQQMTNEEGRPLFKMDEEPRKQRVDTPKSKPGVAELFVWATDALEEVSVLSQGYMQSKGKTDMRQLTRDESQELENLKLYAFLNLEPMSKINAAAIHKAISSKTSPLFSEFSNIRSSSANLQDYKNHVIARYVESVSG
tara:strand:+ start:1066 stop:3066 length:2001 start_codon:yes stop_codon:yes gene_type:complete